VVVWNGVIWLKMVFRRQEAVEISNETSCFIEGGEFIKINNKNIRNTLAD
jgi:hypothetical protein